MRLGLPKSGNPSPHTPATLERISAFRQSALDLATTTRAKELCVALLEGSDELDAGQRAGLGAVIAGLETRT